MKHFFLINLLTYFQLLLFSYATLSWHLHVLIIYARYCLILREVDFFLIKDIWNHDNHTRRKQGRYKKCSCNIYSKVLHPYLNKKKKHSFFTSSTNPLFKYGVADYVTHTAALYLVGLYYYIGENK